jgi:glycosyltransferase involved in cell wall biosynthesis
MASRIDVLMSTYNGAKYLDPQLRSILDQTGVELRLVVRDDGSSDRSGDLVAEYAGRDPRVTLERGSRMGAAGSFLRLLAAVPESTSFAAFADQDDVWNPDKLARAVDALSPYAEIPALYCSTSLATDQDLRVIGVTPHWRKVPSFANALVENIATGCTIVMNRAALDLFRGRPVPAAALSHDWWCYIVVAAFGIVVFDPIPSMFYRQHSSNAIGVTMSPAIRMIKKVVRQFRTNGLRLIRAQAEAFQRLYGNDLVEPNRSALALLQDRGLSRTRIQLVLSNVLYRQSFLDDVFLKARLLIGRS